MLSFSANLLQDDVQNMKHVGPLCLQTDIHGKVDVCVCVCACSTSVVAAYDCMYSSPACPGQPSRWQTCYKSTYPNSYSVVAVCMVWEVWWMYGQQPYVMHRGIISDETTM